MSNTSHIKAKPILVKAKKIADLLSVTDRQVYYWAKTGKIPSVPLGTNCVRFDEAAVLGALGVEWKGGSK